MLLCPNVISEDFQLEKLEQMPLPKEEGKFRNTVILLNDLALAVEYWHEAWKRGDGIKMAKHEKNIYELIDNDIKAAVYRKADCEPTSKEFVNQRNLLKIKLRLFDNIQNGYSFAYRYRLLSDYQGLMKQEVKDEAYELAKEIDTVNQFLDEDPN